MKQAIRLALALLLLITATDLFSQPVRDAEDRLIDNNLVFHVISEKVHARGMMEVCISDTTGNCIENLVSGFVIRVYDANGAELWAGKTAGREEMLIFPKPMPEASWLVFTAFKPYVLNRLTGDRIYQDQPIETKYILSNE